MAWNISGHLVLCNYCERKQTLTDADQANASEWSKASHYTERRAVRAIMRQTYGWFSPVDTSNETQRRDSFCCLRCHFAGRPRGNTYSDFVIDYRVARQNLISKAWTADAVVSTAPDFSNCSISRKVKDTEDKWEMVLSRHISFVEPTKPKKQWSNNITFEVYLESYDASALAEMSRMLTAAGFKLVSASGIYEVTSPAVIRQLVESRKLADAMVTAYENRQTPDKCAPKYMRDTAPISMNIQVLTVTPFSDVPLAN